jgi:FixJ family two-component response regulator
MVAVVEDDPAMRRSLERLLRANGYTTTALSSAEDFLQSGVGDHAVALILDIHLGGMSGIELRRRLLAAGSQLPVIFISAYEDQAIRAEALATGCLDFLIKPFEPSRLMDALTRCMNP